MDTVWLKSKELDWATVYFECHLAQHWNQTLLWKIIKWLQEGINKRKQHGGEGLTPRGTAGVHVLLEQCYRNRGGVTSNPDHQQWGRRSLLTLTRTDSVWCSCFQMFSPDKHCADCSTANYCGPVSVAKAEVVRWGEQAYGGVLHSSCS